MITHNPNAPPMPHAANRKERRALKAEPQEEPKPRAFVPKPCSCCKALREADPKAKGRNYTRVTSVHRVYNVITRYVKCDYCGATDKESETV